MPVCSKCGAELDEAAKFCMECGTPVSQNKKCVKCGAELPNNAKFCFSCGAPQDVATPIAEKAEPKNNAGESSDSEENIVGKNKSSSTEETFTDPRDGEVYRTCKIGNQIWMAENLRYRPPKGGSYPYDKNKDYVEKYGRLYEWECVKEAVPPGWHLPSEEETKKMIAFIEKNYNGSDALHSEDWDDGIDSYGFNAIPSGFRGWKDDLYSSVDEFREDYRKFVFLGNSAVFWINAEINVLRIDSERVYIPQNDIVQYINDNEEYTFNDNQFRQYYACSIRCIKDAPIEIQCDFCKKTFNASKNPIKTFEQEYIDGSPIQKKDIIKRMCYGCQNTIGRDFIKKQAKLERKYKKQ
ncbi:FISUMP domain-containing protein [Fibrobacter sp. UWB13]|uniref:FISUMP domain-containing protein n=1 Tax=Fibrobacter sp. UWB13 TaxID=1896204 RepID=UPI000A09B7A9|nr:FISUMP domain-containing protein [Fibrobacter sp. UWB13]SMG07409.1 major paralogous domain-containing protein [Fibrobacter sp. UWB13]